MAREPGLARRRYRHDARADSVGRRSAATAPPARDRDPVLGRSAPRSCGRQSCAARRRVQKRPGALRNAGAGVAPRVGLLLLHQRRGGAILCRRRVGSLPAQARGARLLRQPVRARRCRLRRDAADEVDLPAADRKPRRAVRRAGRRGLRRGHCRTGAAPARGVAEARAMNIGMVCYASVGGSGVVATELAHALAGRGHHVHIISSEPPFRWRAGALRLSFTPVEVPSYPLFREPQYLLALTNTIVRVAREQRLDIVHAHYAVPHATAAYLADRILTAERIPAPPRMVTTLHGTDITYVGSDPSYRHVVAFSIEQSHAVTAVSSSLRHDTLTAVGVGSDIRVIPNFLDCQAYSRRPDLEARRAIAPDDVPIIMHVSNFRP